MKLLIVFLVHKRFIGHKVTVGGEFGHETISRVVKVGKNVTEFKVGERVYPYPLYAKNYTSRAGTIGLAAAVALKYFGMDKVMLCDVSDFRLNIAKNLGFAVCNTEKDNFIEKATDYFSTAFSLNGMVPDIDCWIDAAGSESILNLFMQYGKIISRFVVVAVNNKPRQIDLLHMTYSQKSIIGSGGYFPEDVQDVMDIMASGKWNLESIITQEFPLEQISRAIQTAASPSEAFNVVIRF